MLDPLWKCTKAELWQHLENTASILSPHFTHIYFPLSSFMFASRRMKIWFSVTVLWGHGFTASVEISVCVVNLGIQEWCIMKRLQWEQLSHWEKANTALARITMTCLYILKRKHSCSAADSVTTDKDLLDLLVSSSPSLLSHCPDHLIHLRPSHPGHSPTFSSHLPPAQPSVSATVSNDMARLMSLRSAFHMVHTCMFPFTACLLRW